MGGNTLDKASVVSLNLSPSGLLDAHQMHLGGWGGGGYVEGGKLHII